MKRKQCIPALERAQKIAAQIPNDQLESFKKTGGKVVGVISPDTPVEILEAAGLMPYDLRGTGTSGTEFSDAYFRQLTCEFARTTFNEICEGQYSCLDGAVMYNNCDHLRRIPDNWLTLPDNPFYYLLYIPKKRSDEAYVLYKEQVRGLVQATEKRFGLTITAQGLEKAIIAANQTRALVRELYELRRGEKILIDGTEIAAVLLAGCSIPRPEYNQLLRELIDSLRAADEGTIAKRRLLLACGHANTPEFFEALESQGGLIVIDSLASGLKSCEQDIPLDGDPLENLCRYYFWTKSPMPRVFNTQDERMNWYLEKIRDYRVDGVISARLTMCDLWAFEQFMLTKTLEAKGIPSMELEVNYLLDGVGQIHTRMQAFIENCPRRAN